ncbi:uncharacterized protein LOC112093854 isoform X2 [Morus notabilis]|uniref:uncharacterized protein LOC112093854 isoform X2 n=1 Tax=Morus notabilis TaxID=981085 RepID=UPI000CED0435|nr:uncharacterized protein LOC112093854 isoform X2 [Morus notabilis]
MTPSSFPMSTYLHPLRPSTPSLASKAANLVKSPSEAQIPYKIYVFKRSSPGLSGASPSPAQLFPALLLVLAQSTRKALQVGGSLSVVHSPVLGARVL